jgi:hypothetical protein
MITREQIVSWKVVVSICPSKNIRGYSTIKENPKFIG